MRIARPSSARGVRVLEPDPLDRLLLELERFDFPRFDERDFVDWRRHYPSPSCCCCWPCCCCCRWPCCCCGLLALLTGQLSDPLLDALADSRDSAARALADFAKALLGSLADTRDPAACALADFGQGLPGSLSDLAERRARTLADLGHRLPGALADVLDGVSGLVEQMSRAASDLLDRLAHSLEQLRIAVQRQQHPLEDLGDVVQPRFEQRLGLDALDLQLDLAQVRLRAHAQVHQLPDLRENGDPRIQIVDLDVDLVDLDDGDVDQDVRALRHVVRVDDRVVRELLALALAAPR